MHRASFRQVLAANDPLILVGAHDGLSARLIEQAGYPAFFIGGFPLVGARYGVPDIGIKGLGEIAAGVRDILGATGCRCWSTATTVMATSRMSPTPCAPMRIWASARS